MNKLSATREAKPLTDVGELRQDFITGKWVVIATGRAKRPHEISQGLNRPKRFVKVDNRCPFCRLDKFPQETDILRLPDDPDEWEVHIFPNKYPAFSPTDEFSTWNTGPYRAMDSVGYHEILSTRWHNEIDAMLTQRQLSLQLEALQIRYRQLREKPSVNYIQIIKNQGNQAGGTIEHPHHQILTVPVLPDDIQDLLLGTKNYADTKGREPFGVMLDFELQDTRRLVDANDSFVAFCPYASRVPFEVWIMPRRHSPYFEDIGPLDRDHLADLLGRVLSKLYSGLKDPAYNYYILSAPCDNTGSIVNQSLLAPFRWHVEILPRINIWGGFELGTGLEINTTLPEDAAAFLREQKIDVVKLKQ